LAGSRPPSEGTNALRPRAGGAAPANLPTCSLADRLADVRDRVRAAAGMPGSPSTSSGAPRSSGRARLADRAGHAPSGRARCSRSSRSRRSRGSWSNTTWGTAPITTSQGQLVGLLRRQAVLRVVADLQPDQPDGTDNRAQPSSLRTTPTARSRAMRTDSGRRQSTQEFGVPTQVRRGRHEEHQRVADPPDLAGVVDWPIVQMLVIWPQRR